MFEFRWRLLPHRKFAIAASCLLTQKGSVSVLLDSCHGEVLGGSPRVSVKDDIGRRR